MPFGLFAFLAILAVPAFAEGPHDTVIVPPEPQPLIVVPGQRVRQPRSCARPCVPCMSRCVGCDGGCCSFCVTSGTFTQANARNVCESVGGFAAPASKVAAVLEPLKIQSPVWAAETTARPAGLFGLRTRFSGLLVNPNGTVVEVRPSLKFPAVCELN